MLILLNETFFWNLFHIALCTRKEERSESILQGKMRLCLAIFFELNASQLFSCCCADDVGVFSKYRKIRQCNMMILELWEVIGSRWQAKVVSVCPVMVTVTNAFFLALISHRSEIQLMQRIHFVLPTGWTYALTMCSKAALKARAFVYKRAAPPLQYHITLGWS